MTLKLPSPRKFVLLVVPYRPGLSYSGCHFARSTKVTSKFRWSNGDASNMSATVRSLNAAFKLSGGKSGTKNRLTL